MNITTVKEGRRGCGYRKPGGLYLRTDGVGSYCGKLPIPLTICPTCSHGIKPARGWTWVDGDELVKGTRCKLENLQCGGCLLGPATARIGKVGLLWIGKEYYPTTHDWLRECETMGVSRRITAVPKKFVLGETWVFAAHRKAIVDAKFGEEPKYTPGVFHVFRPSKIEYVVKKGDKKKKLESLEKRGITLIKVIQVQEDGSPNLPF